MAAKQDKYIEAVGRRKTSSSRVRITPSAKAVFTVNDKPIAEYFFTKALEGTALRPLAVLKEAEVSYGAVSLSAKVEGGGIASQAGAVSHGLARALIEQDPLLRGVLKRAGLLTRDPRMKERRKFGLKKARKAPQWSKR
ncbi:MAG: 30S ribosomal protein S9 [bacterium]|nr:30S ribosomal protein S9 [bacterium]